VNADLIAAELTVLFLSLPSADAATERVQLRVAQGGHAIPEEVIRRRFAAGRSNFERLYKPLVDAWALYESPGSTPVLLDWDEKR
jgi:predicted ABC-type ATPase